MRLTGGKRRILAIFLLTICLVSMNTTNWGMLIVDATSTTKVGSTTKTGGTMNQAEVKSKLAAWLGRDEASEEEIYSWTLFISTLKTDGYPAVAIAGVAGNMKAEGGGKPYSLEGMYGSIACKIDGVSGSISTSELEAGHTYEFEEKPDTYQGAWYNGHGIIQFSGPWAEDLCNWAETCDFPTVTIKHQCSPLSGYGSSTLIWHECKLPNSTGQLMYLMDCVNKGVHCDAGVVDDLKNASSVYKAAESFHDKVEKSATSNISERASYGEEFLPIAEMVTAPIGANPNGSLSNSQKEDASKLAVSMVGLGYWDESKFVEFCRITEMDLYFPDNADLNYDDLSSLIQWKDTIKHRQDAKARGYLRTIIMIIGIAVVVYSIFIYTAFWFDSVNNIFDISLLPMLTMNKLYVAPTAEESTFKNKDSNLKLLSHKDMFKVAIAGLFLGVLLISGKAYDIAVGIINWVRKLFGI